MKMKFIGLGLVLILAVLISAVASRSSLWQLDEDNWPQILEGEWMVEFFAPWCPACKALQPIWEDYASWSDDLDISVGQVDVTASPGLSGRFMITALPTIYHVKDGKFRQYKGARDRDEFISFIEDKKWEELEVVSSWKAPDSMQMSLISHFFKLSMLLRNVHTRLTEDYGIPTWGSYLIFALATIMIGAFLGLVLVCLIDCCCPPKPLQDVSSLNKKDDDLPAESTGDGDGGKEETVDYEEKTEEDVAREENEGDEEKTTEELGRESQTEEEEEEEEGDVPVGTGSPSVRKRRPRKAD